MLEPEEDEEPCLPDYEALCELFRSLDEGERTRWKTTTIFEITIPWW